MDAIKNLLKALDNKVPTSLSKKLNGLESLYARLEVAKKELAEKPEDEDLKESLSEITDYLNDYEQDLIDDLETLLEAKGQEELKIKNEIRRQNLAKKLASEKEAEELEKQKKEAEELERQKKEEENTKTEKKSSSWTYAIIGGVLLIGTFGAINILKNK